MAAEPGQPERGLLHEAGWCAGRGLGECLHVDSDKLCLCLHERRWVIAAAIVQTNVDSANDKASDPALANIADLKDWRTATVVLMWVEVGLFCLMAITALFRVRQPLHVQRWGPGAAVCLVCCACNMLCHARQPIRMHAQAIIQTDPVWF